MAAKPHYEVAEVVELQHPTVPDGADGGGEWWPGKVLAFDSAKGCYKVEKISPAGNEIVSEVQPSAIRKMSKKKRAQLEETNFGKPRVKYDITEGLPKEESPELVPLMQCARPGCNKVSRLRCPHCRKLDVPEKLSYFCTQTCFKAFYPEHKKIHKAAKDGSITVKSKEMITQLDNLPIKVEPMPMDLFQQLVPESSLDGSGAFEWSQKEIRLFDEKGKVRNRPKLSMILREQALIKAKASGAKALTMGGAGAGAAAGPGGQLVKSSKTMRKMARGNSLNLTEVVNEATYSCRMSHCHWRHKFEWTPTVQTKLLSQYWTESMDHEARQAVMRVVRSEILENVGKCFCFLEGPVRKAGMDMYFKDIAYLSMWKRLFMLLVEKDVKAVVNQRLLFEIFENVENYIDESNARDVYGHVQEIGDFNHAMQEHCKLVFVTELLKLWLNNLQSAYDQERGEDDRKSFEEQVRQNQERVALEEEEAKKMLEAKGQKSRSKRKKKKAKNKENKRAQEELEEARVKLEQQKLEQRKEQQKQEQAKKRQDQEMQERNRSGYWLQQQLESARMQLDLKRATSEDGATLREALQQTSEAYEALRSHYEKSDEDGLDAQAMLREVAEELAETREEIAALGAGAGAGEGDNDKENDASPSEAGAGNGLPAAEIGNEPQAAGSKIHAAGIGQSIGDLAAQTAQAEAAMQLSMPPHSSLFSPQNSSPETGGPEDEAGDAIPEWA